MNVPPRQAAAGSSDVGADGETKPVDALASRLHSAAIHLLRRLRRVDPESGLTASRLSALSVIVYAGPLRIGELATAEQVSAPTISRLVRELQGEELVRRLPDPSDGRAHLVEATDRGRALLERGRRRRVELLAARLDALGEGERALLERATALLERVSLPEDHPSHGPAG